MPNKTFPVMLASLIGVFILFLAWSAFQASTEGTRVTDRDYYSKGLKYNTTQVEKRAAVAMGWQLTTLLEKHLLTIQLTDGEKSPVTSANGILHLYSRPDNDPLTLKLAEQSPGRYSAELPANLRGELTVRVEFERDSARLNRQLLINLR